MPRPAIVDKNVLRMALLGYEQEKARIEASLADIYARLRTPNPAFTVTAEVAPTKGRMSAAARKRIGEATRKRWMAFRKQKAEAEKAAAKPKRQLSKAGRAAIVAATKKRWAAVHKAQKSAVKETSRVAKKAVQKRKVRQATAKAQTTTTAAAPVTS